jgi:hypothetical protein
MTTAAVPACRVDYDDLVEALQAVAGCIEAEDAGAEPALRAPMSRLSGHADPRCVGLAGFEFGVKATLALHADGPVRIGRNAGHLSLDAIDEPVVAIFTAAPRQALPVRAAWAAE